MYQHLHCRENLNQIFTEFKELSKGDKQAVSLWLNQFFKDYNINEFNTYLKQEHIVLIDKDCIEKKKKAIFNFRFLNKETGQTETKYVNIDLWN